MSNTRSKYASTSNQETENKAEDASYKSYQSVLEDSRAQSSQNWCKQDAHKLRLKELRTSLLKHIQDTDWMYNSADKHLGKE